MPFDHSKKQINSVIFRLKPAGLTQAIQSKSFGANFLGIKKPPPFKRVGVFTYFPALKLDPNYQTKFSDQCWRNKFFADKGGDPIHPDQEYYSHQ